ncbi:MAG TPA: carbonic anhydrase, partial [Longimicrobium sp.]
MSLSELLERNKGWVRERLEADPDCFTNMAARHEPHYLWIGCSDARVPANVVTRTDAGEMFVHRNIANLVVPTDHNLLAVLQYAVEVLRVQDVIVCGHEGCGGVRAALGETPLPAVDAWLEHVRVASRVHAAELAALPDEDARWRRLVSLNVMEQVSSLSRLPIVRAAWARGDTLRLHGLVYDIADGVLRDLGVTRDGPAAFIES